MSEAIFVGLDLAWSSRHNTAGAAIRLDKSSGRAELINWREQLGDNDAIMAWLRTVAATHQTVLVAIDAPLVVPNVGGAREGDKQLSRVFRAYQAGTHPANRTNLGRYGQPPGDIRGETLAARMENELNFRQNPYLETQAEGRFLFECYPHPAMVVFFGLATTLKYKRKLRSVANDRFAAYAALQNYLGELAQASPPLLIPAELLSRDTRQMRGQALKHYEDLLDAIVCAYIAFYYWWWGPKRTYVFGSLATGYIVAPITPELRLTIDG
jgi:predicted RNase H-like nuclease